MKRHFLLALVSIASTSYLFGVGSGAFSNQVVSSKALGMGNAFAATADDPSAVFFNPAGLTQLKSAEISVGFAPHIYGTNYRMDNGVENDSDKQTPIVPNFYASL